MTPTAESALPTHEDTWLLLPWLANGQAPEALRERASQHVKVCAICRAELDLQRQLCEALSAPERISYAPGPSLAKLMRRIETAQKTGQKTGQTSPDAVPMHAARARVPARGWWRSPALTWAASCVLALGLVSGLAYRGLTPAYQVRSDAPVPGNGKVLHIIFVHTLTVSQVEELLRASGAQLAEGPVGEAGVFGVRPAYTSGNAAQQLQGLAARLRNDQRVRWVEPLATP
jgi:hypothetical protein